MSAAWKFVWRRLNESPTDRGLRIQRLGFIRLCACYIVVFPLANFVALAGRAWFTSQPLVPAVVMQESQHWAFGGLCGAVGVWLLQVLNRRLTAARARATR